ncbi:mevalonate kinase-like isoform X1 [Anoplolepis gracilipes]|uniref:mevalonate kinase-like isoform X1 n=1 Tax=Anoplolepis gracilipes TaxID=354296 RepID=UPI003BA3602C
MIKFKISAPGRICLSGEHVAMYGKRVVVGSLNLRTTLKFVELINKSDDFIKIDFPDVDVSLNVSWETLRNFFSINNVDRILKNKILLLKQVQYFITSNGMWSTYAQKFSLQIFFFLLFRIGHYEKLKVKPFHVHLTTQLTIDAGLGSSTSFAVCLAACFLHWARLQAYGTHDAFEDNDLEDISTYASLCEQVIQRYMTDFMIDNEVCTFDQVFKYMYRDPENYIAAYVEAPEIKILLIDSKIYRNKYKQVQQMAKLKHSRFKDVNDCLDRIDEISLEIWSLLQEIAINHKNLLQRNNSFAVLQIFIRMYQDMLFDFNMSHSNLDIICSIVRNYKFVGKLTGFGGGGFVYILLPPNIPQKRVTNLSTQLIAQGFNVTLTNVSCNGVRIDD